ncbi:hypothetical protein HNY73_023209 [Argiope bruennichi]|uniref:ISXO2-like transposase domain-containing protein n=1 Tax=Argiope bruennichi TaxID=94029 RepID=A0A8T0E3D8_ARGBR|nr:hypothetical protein HNY73_023209 [Argiope bruennichi]
MLIYLRVYEADTNMLMNEVNGRSNKTVANWSNFCREVCMDVCVKKSEMIGCPGIVVEIDESKFGIREYNRGRRVNGKWVFSEIERGSRKCFWGVVEDRPKETLLEVIKRKLLPGTTITSDYCKSYDCLGNEGLSHLSVNHSLNFVDLATGAYTNSVENTYGSQIKREFHKNVRQLSGTFSIPILPNLCGEGDQTEADPFRDFFSCIKDLYMPQLSDDTMSQ